MSNVPNYQTPEPVDPVQSFIPYKNMPALISYYVGIFSILPCVGVIMGPIAIFLGIKGLKLARQHPEARGKGHAITGIICGSLFGLLWLLLDALFVLGFIFGMMHHRVT